MNYDDAAQEADGIPLWRLATTGRCFVYLFPLRDRDALKLGFSRNPRARLHALHTRYFELFDLARGALIEVEHVRDASAIERDLKRRFAASVTQAPLVVSAAAGGHTEWYGGVQPEAMQSFLELRARHGHTLHESLEDWLRQQFIDDDALFDWSMQAFERLEFEHFNATHLPARHGRHLRNVLDAYAALGVHLQGRIDDRVQIWHERGFPEAAR